MEAAGVRINFFSDIYPELATVLLEFNGKQILIDPGIDRSRYAFVDRILERYNLANLDAIVITHYHGDHSNMVKKILAREDFKGQIICHKATAEIMHIYFDILRSPNRFTTLDYDIPYHLFEDSVITLYNAGHVLGSSIAYFNLGGKIIMVSGDLGSKHLPIVRQPHQTFPATPINLIILDAKQATVKTMPEGSTCSLGDILFLKLNDCLMFDDGNILIFAPLIQIPMLLYCLNYIFSKPDYAALNHKIARVYVDTNQTLNELLAIFHSHAGLFDSTETEYIADDTNPFRFNNLAMSLPEERYLHRSIIITFNHGQFVRFFKQLKQSEKNDVLLLNNNIHYALNHETFLIDRRCNIQIKRLPFLHHHPSQSELIQWCASINQGTKINRIILYHYRETKKLSRNIFEFRKKMHLKVDLVHQLKNNSLFLK